MASQWHKTKRRRRSGRFEPGPGVGDMVKLIVIGPVIGYREFQGVAIVGVGQAVDLPGRNRNFDVEVCDCKTIDGASGQGYRSYPPEKPAFLVKLFNIPGIVIQDHPEVAEVGIGQHHEVITLGHGQSRARVSHRPTCGIIVVIGRDRPDQAFGGPGEDQDLAVLQLVRGEAIPDIGAIGIVAQGDNLGTLT